MTLSTHSSNRKFLAEPVSDDMEDMKTNILGKRETLALAKDNIDYVLNPSEPNYDSTVTETDVFNSTGITEDQYYLVLSISPDSDYELHLQRPIDNCFIINYFIAGLRFAANVDLQPVFNHHKCIIYLCSYFIKNETECSQAIIIVGKGKEAKDTNMNT